MNTALPVKSIGVCIFGIFIMHLFLFFSFSLTLEWSNSSSNRRLSILVFGDWIITSVIIWSSKKQTTRSDLNNCSKELMMLSVLTSTLEVCMLLLVQKKEMFNEHCLLNLFHLNNTPEDLCWEHYENLKQNEMYAHFSDRITKISSKLDEILQNSNRFDFSLSSFNLKIV